MKRIKAISILLMASMFAGNMLLCSCSKPAETSDTSADETTTTAATATTAATTTEETTEEITEPTNFIPDSSFTTNYEEITLDGDPDSVFVSTDYCYLESDKYFLLIEPGIKLPGDYADNLDAIIDEIEKELGMELCTPDYEYSHGIIDNSVYYDGFNPWDNWSLGTKLPIFLIADETDEGLISCGDSEFAFFVEYELFSDEIWNSCPSYYENTDWRRLDYIDYTTAAHELTHSITGRNGKMSKIVTEGIAEYMGRSVIEALASDHPSIGITYERHYRYDNGVPEPVNADNAESIFLDDYQEIDAAGRGAEYVYGRYFWQFLFENYGSDAYFKYNEMVKSYHIEGWYGYYEEGANQKFTDAAKAVFGDDVFEEFGDWCVENDALQSVDGVYPIPEDY